MPGSSASDPRVLARIDQLRGHVMLRRGPVADGYTLLAEAAEQVADLEPELAVVMLAESVHGAFYGGHTPAMVAAADRAAAIAAGTVSARAAFFAGMATRDGAGGGGDGEDGAAHARLAIAILEDSDELRDDPRLLTWATSGRCICARHVGRVLIDRAAEQARAQGAAGVLPTILQLLARDQATTDRWAAAEANYDEAIRLAEETGQRAELAAVLAGLAWLEARQGREDECRRHAAAGDRAV